MEYEDNLDYEDAILLLRRLHPSRSRIHFEGETCIADFDLDLDCSISVEIMSLTDEFWAISEVSESEAESILRMAYHGEDFSQFIPGTDREWGAWGPSD